MAAIGQSPPGRPRPPGPADPVLSSGEVARLLRTQAPDASLTSVYLTVPLDPAGRRSLPARLDELLRAAQHAPAAREALARARRLQLPVIKDVVSARAADWLGRSVAIFACPDLNLLEAIPLRGQVAERAVVGTRPYIRPLLADLRRSPSYLAVVVDRRQAWLWRVSGNGIEPRGSVQGDTVASRRFGGWHGLAAYRNQQRARGLARKHYARTVSALTGALAGCGPLAIGGHEADTAAFRTALPQALAERVAGTFVIDPHTMTPARVRQLADGVVSGWENARENGLAAEVAGAAADPMTAQGLGACLAAANEHAIRLLVVPDDMVRPGFACQRCDALAAAAGPCPVCAGPTGAVPDVIEELIVKVTRDGGTVEPVPAAAGPAGSGPADVAARRRFPR